MTKRSLVIIGGIAVLAVMATLLVAEPSLAGKLEDAIAKTPVGDGPGMIHPAAPKGFMGIPGAPHHLFLFYILWGIWVGWIFSSVGAFGGIMAGVGHISVFGLGNYAHSFGEKKPLNSLITDSIRASNQYLVGLSALISSITYYRMGRLVLPLGLALGLGSLGAVLAANYTAGKIDLKMYMGYFGLIVFAVAFVLFYETTPQGQARKKAAKAAAKAFEDAHIRKTAEVSAEHAKGVHVIHWGLTKIAFTFYGSEFSFNPIWPFIGGMIISAISAFIGVGGGFLYVPFLTSVTGLPMFIVAGTSALAVLISMISSIITYMLKGTPLDFSMISMELIGIFIGSILGPATSKYLSEIWLKRIFVVLAIYVGMGYTLKGFFKIVLPGI